MGESGPADRASSRAPFRDTGRGPGVMTSSPLQPDPSRPHAPGAGPTPEPGASEGALDPALANFPLLGSNLGGALGGGLGAKSPIHEGSGPHMSASVGLIASSADRPGVVPGARDTYGVEELAIVLSRFDLGPIEAIQDFRRGSRRSPKLLIKSAAGLFLLKRRAPGRDENERVDAAHAVQNYLASNQFPVPRLLPTRGDRATALRLGGRVYELFEFIPGSRYDGSLAATSDAGHTLALFHKIVSGFHGAPPTHHPHGYHALPGCADALDHIPRDSRIGRPELAGVCNELRGLYLEAARRADRLGLREWPSQIVHGDWHPGNTLYRGQRLVAVIDFDGVRPEQRALDIANGALQFSITMEGQEVEKWPDYLDESRFKRFCRGYDAVEGCILSTSEIQALPWLMIEALIVEAALPVAATGAFAGLDGGSFLTMVLRKARWLEAQAPRLSNLLTA